MITPDRLRERTAEIEERNEALKKANGSYNGLTYWQKKNLKGIVQGIDEALVRYTNCGATEMIFPYIFTEEYSQWLTAHYRKRGFTAYSEIMRVPGERISGFGVYLCW